MRSRGSCIGILVAAGLAVGASAAKADVSASPDSYDVTAGALFLPSTVLLANDTWFDIPQPRITIQQPPAHGTLTLIPIRGINGIVIDYGYFVFAPGDANPADPSQGPYVGLDTATYCFGAQLGTCASNVATISFHVGAGAAPPAPRRVGTLELLLPLPSLGVSFAATLGRDGKWIGAYGPANHSLQFFRVADAAGSTPTIKPLEKNTEARPFEALGAPGGFDPDNPNVLAFLGWGDGAHASVGRLDAGGMVGVPWKDASNRVALTYALDDARKVVVLAANLRFDSARFLGFDSSLHVLRQLELAHTAAGHHFLAPGTFSDLEDRLRPSYNASGFLDRNHVGAYRYASEYSFFYTNAKNDPVAPPTHELIQLTNLNPKTLAPGPWITLTPANVNNDRQGLDLTATFNDYWLTYRSLFPGDNARLEVVRLDRGMKPLGVIDVFPEIVDPTWNAVGGRALAIAPDAVSVYGEFDDANHVRHYVERTIAGGKLSAQLGMDYSVSGSGGGLGLGGGSTFEQLFPQSAPPPPFREGAAAAATGAGLYRSKLIFPQSCVPSDTTLCLNGGRFRVDVAAMQSGQPRTIAHGVKLTDDTGYFWYFDPKNVELVLKVINGCGLGGRYWVYAGGLTDVLTEIWVTDTTTGRMIRFGTPQGKAFAPYQNSAAFACATSAAAMASEPPTLAAAPAPTPALLGGLAIAAAPATACVADETHLCLGSGRFAVSAAWETNDGKSGDGHAVPILPPGVTQPDTGYFWFFNAANVELLLKVVAGCGLNQRYWVFGGGLTNVKVTTTVRDTASGLVRTYVNPKDTPFRPLQDTSAFATCP